LAELVERHHRMLLAICRRMLGAGGAAEDAAHEAILQALLNLDRLRQPDRFGSWLAGIGLNICRRYSRDRHAAWSREDLYGGIQGHDLPDEGSSPEEHALELELAERVREAVSSLPPGQRAAVLLFYLSGLTHAETAAALGVQVSAVKTRLHKARRSLRQELRTTWKEDHMAEPTDQAVAQVDMRVVDVRRDTKEGEDSPRHVVILQEAEGDRGVLIWVGQFEATAIAVLLEGVETPRPMTLALAADAIRALGGNMVEARITRLVEDVFYASVLVDGRSGRITLDARPSDALALALTFDAPIRADPSVLVAAGIPEFDSAASGTREGAKVLVQIMQETQARIFRHVQEP
jgi:RNA polymerase sigma factor (sigma-70 family)